MTGFIVGVTGVGGGALMTPMLLLVFGIAPHVAVGTDLWYAALTKVAASGVYIRHGLIDWAVVMRLWAGSLPASAATVWWMRSTTISGIEWMRGAIAVMVCITAVGMLFSGQLHAVGFRFADRLRPWQAPMTVVLGAVLGAVVTLTSVGAGALGAVCLLYLYPRRLATGALVATDIAHAIPLALIAGLGHLTLANVDSRLLLHLLAGSVPAAVIGARLSARVPHPRLRRWLAAVLLVVGIRMVVDLVS